MHITVLKEEAIKLLDIKKDGTYIDLTGGRGGHSLLLLSKLNNNGKLIIFDQDEFAYNNLVKTFKENKNVKVIKANFKNFDEHLEKLGITSVDGFLFDLGMSSDQIDNPERGFSYLSENSLDMRMSKENPLTAKDFLNTASKKDLADVFYKYGEYKKSYLLADLIIKARPINNSTELVNLCDKLKDRKEKGHSAKKVFQALRIYINDELGSLEEMLSKLDKYLNIGGVISGITFHSLEDRIVKLFFNSLAKVKIDKYSPIQIEEEKNYKLLTKGIKPTEEEILNNPRAKSAILRGVKKIK